MALIKCPECGNECSDKAEFCPKCGYPFKKKEPKGSSEPVEYETQVIKMRVWGRSQAAINRELNETLMPYKILGWEYVSMVEDHMRGGWASPVYWVTLRRPTNFFDDDETNENNDNSDLFDFDEGEDDDK